ncbi:MAG: bifunctional glycosyltransferase family 2/GtrA family protein [Alkalibacterium sp.]|nr:bifunctional glycosyltransferase family 2/GtrA family protein [Alkalibacterium sp.]
MKNCIIVIPVLNPDKSFYPYVEKLHKERFRSILIVNDGSEEELEYIFNRCKHLEGVKVLKHAVNLGKGRALKSAFNYILNNEHLREAEGVITVDADGQHKLEDVMTLCGRLSESERKLVLGVRSFEEKHVPRKNMLGNTITRKVFKLLYGTSLQDTQTGLRGLSMDILQYYIDLEGERFNYETNMLIETVSKRFDIEEVPIETVYIDDNNSSHFNKVKDSFEIYLLLFKNFFKFISVSFISFIIDISLFQLFLFILRFTFSRRQIVAATLLARAGSSLFNYTMNRSFVFESGKKWNKTIVGYYTLVVAEALLSGFSVYLLYQLTGIRQVVIKVFVDLIIFLISYRVQKLIVFRD